VKWARSIVTPVVGVVVFLAVWESFVRAFDIRRFVLTAPTEILSELLDDPNAYWSNTLVTAQHLAGGLLISVAVSLVVGSVMAASRYIEEATAPVLIIILVTPWVAYINSVVIWLGFNDRPIIFMVAFTSFPLLTFGVVTGMKSADPAARELFASVDASRWEVLWRLRLPSALPTVLTTARFAVALGLGAAYFSEGASSGLRGLGVIGRRAALDQTRGAEVLWTTIFCTAALGISGLVALSLVEKTALRWHASQRD
jgi:NitT/TauT family transport system permease protein